VTGNSAVRLQFSGTEEYILLFLIRENLEAGIALSMQCLWVG
jgi:hypothetical protein